MKRAAITRAQPDAERTADRVRALGADAVLAPLLSIEPRAFDANLADVQALLFTSANGVRAFTNAAPRRDVATLTVGDATARAARDAGFTEVRAADGDSSALAAFACATLDPRGGRVLHISGEDVAGDLVGALQAAGFDAQRRIAYAAIAAAELPQALRGSLDIVLFHSARAAEVFVRFGAPGAEMLTAACLSPAIARAAQGLPQGPVKWARTIVAPHPREEDLLHAALAPTGAKA